MTAFDVVVVGRVGSELVAFELTLWLNLSFPFESYLDVAPWFCWDIEPQKVEIQL